MLGNSSVAERPLASQEELGFSELVKTSTYNKETGVGR
jgi:hypothetical protein